MHVENLRSSPPGTIAALTQDLFRQHVERIEPTCVADLFALSELDLPGPLGGDLRGWASKASREIHDLPEGEVRAAFLADVGELKAADVPRSMREVIAALATKSGADTQARVEALTAAWDAEPPAAVSLPTAKPRAAAVQAAATARATTAEAATARKSAEPKAPKAPRATGTRTPAKDVDPRRAEWIRGDALGRLGAPEYVERGLKEAILLAGIKHRSPYTDLTDEEIKVELRKLVREGRLKHTGERWLAK
jgi:hypothetical protein